MLLLTSTVLDASLVDGAVVSTGTCFSEMDDGLTRFVGRFSSATALAVTLSCNRCSVAGRVPTREGAESALALSSRRRGCVLMVESTACFLANAGDLASAGLGDPVGLTTVFASERTALAAVESTFNAVGRSGFV